MKSVFRSFHSPKQLLPLFKPTPSLSRQFPRFFGHCPQFSRQFHSTNSRLCSAGESEPNSTNPITQNSPRLWTVYNLAIANQVSEPSGERDLGRETTDGNVNTDISGDLEKPNEAVYNHALANQVSESSGEGDLEREKTDGNVKTESSSDLEKPRGKKKTNLGFGEIVRIKKKGKASRVSWVCADCGYTNGQWWGMCSSCESVGTMKRFTEGESGEGHVVERTWLPQKAEEVRPVRLPEVNKGINQLNWRIPLSGLFGNEVASVLGGGLVPGSLVLVGGDPGVGKSTLLLQMAAIIAEGCDHGKSSPVVYVSGEESVEQIGNRADRMRIGTEELFLYSSTDVEDIIEKVQPLSPQALIIDSIQTVYLKGVTGSAGGLMQVKECTSALLRFAKKTNIPVLLVGHVTKSGDIAGPRVLEHIVDAVLYMEGEKYSSYRLLRPVKNRFGSTDELGVFEMSQFGLQAISNPSKMFLSEQHSDSEFLAGLAVAVIVDGSRTFLIEIQALCVSGSTVSRHVNGIQASRADMIISVCTGNFSEFIGSHEASWSDASREFRFFKCC